MAAALATVLNILPSLPTTELNKIKSKIGALLSLREGTEKNSIDTLCLTDSPFDYILEGIVFELRKRGLLTSKGFIPRQYWPKNYDSTAKEIRILLESQFPHPLPQPQLVLLGRICAEALASYLEPVVPISPSSLMSNVHKIPTAIDQILPGYLQAGLLFIVLERSVQL